MRLLFAGAVVACAFAACTYNYEALKGGDQGGGGGPGPGSGGSGGSGPGVAGSVEIAGRGGRGGSSAGAGGGPGGSVGGPAGQGGDGRGGASGAAGAGARGGGGGSAAAGSGGAAAGSGGAGGAGSPAGRGGDGGGTGGAAGRGGTGGVAGGPETDLVLWYKFDDGGGAVAADSSTVAGAPRNAMLVSAGSGGGVSFSTTHQVGMSAVSLTANGATGGGYVTVPSLNDLAPGALTIAVWVNVSTTQRWQRVYDVGSTTTSNLALTTQNGSDFVRFIIRTGSVSQEIISTVMLPLSTWHHLAVVLPEGSTYTGELYVDGVSVATNTAMTLHAADLGATVNNYLGRSQFTADPYFSGLLDDFRVYRRALNREQIVALFNAR